MVSEQHPTVSRRASAGTNVWKENSLKHYPLGLENRADTFEESSVTSNWSSGRVRRIKQNYIQ